MRLKTIAVNLNDLENVDHLLKSCIDLASRHEAHLIGVYVIPAIDVFPAMGAGAVAEIVDMQRKNYLSQSAKIRSKFDEAAKAASVPSGWRQVEANTPAIGPEFVRQARSSDLAVIAQVNRDIDCGVESDFAEYVVMQAGRPVLLYPRGKSFERVGDNAIVAWNGSRESARAAFDALCLLPLDGKATVVWVDPQKQRYLSGNVPGAELATALARHDLKMTAESLPTSDGDVGVALLARAKDINADLLIMGGYGHSRIREFIFGGATEHILNFMTLPVMMSH